MISIDKKITRFRDYFLKYPELRKLCFESDLSSIRANHRKLDLNYPELFLSFPEFDWFRFILNTNPDRDIATIVDYHHRRYAGLAKKLGLTGQLSKLWKHGNLKFTLHSRNSVREAWEQKTELREITNVCNHRGNNYNFDSKCESCLIIDSYFEGINYYTRGPVPEQRQEKYLLIYLIGRDRYLENNGLIPNLK